jgi:lysophospholipase L1-like esterase
VLRRLAILVTRAMLGAGALLAGVLPIAVASAITAKPSQAVTRTTPLTRGSEYLALGDSVTFGYQEPAVLPTPDFARSSTFLGYPEQMGKQLHLKVTNPSCPGETSASLINASAPSNGCENAYRKNYPLHVRYSGSQLTFAISFLKQHPQVKLVSLMIGANDLFRCQSITADHCQSKAEQRATLVKISANVRYILSAIRNRAHYNGQLAILNYYSLNYTSALVNGESIELNQAMDSAARPFHVVIADGYAKFKAASFRFGNQPCLAGLITQTGAYGSCGVHPTYAGQALLAEAVIQAIRL